MQNVTTKYSLTPRQRKALIAHLNGDITVTEAATRMGTKRQYVDRCVAAIAKHAARTGKLDAKELLANY